MAYFRPNSKNLNQLNNKSGDYTSPVEVCHENHNNQSIQRKASLSFIASNAYNSNAFFLCAVLLSILSIG